jgi:hypothetical protein
MKKISFCFLIVAVVVGGVLPASADNLEGLAAAQSDITTTDSEVELREVDPEVLLSPTGQTELERLVSSDAGCAPLRECYRDCEDGRGWWNPRIRICKGWCDILHTLPHIIQCNG